MVQRSPGYGITSWWTLGKELNFALLSLLPKHWVAISMYTSISSLAHGRWWTCSWLLWRRHLVLLLWEQLDLQTSPSNLHVFEMWSNHLKNLANGKTLGQLNLTIFSMFHFPLPPTFLKQAFSSPCAIIVQWIFCYVINHFLIIYFPLFLNWDINDI